MQKELGDLEVEDLSLVRGERMLFRGLGFRLGAGETLALEGPNGSGKTSLLRAIAGFLEPHSGSIRVRIDGSQIFAAGEDRARFVGWLGHLDGFRAQLTPVESLEFYARYYGHAEHVTDVLAELGLARVAELPVQYLSAGQKRRLALARLKLVARPLWLLDEPLAALDRAGKALAARLIADHCVRGGVAVAATHESLGIECGRLVLGNGPA